MAKNSSVGFKKRRAEKTDSIKGNQVGVVRKEFNDAVGIMNDAGLLNNDLTRSAVDFVLKVLDVVAVQPEADGAKDPAFTNVFGDPNSRYAKRLRSGANQGDEELFPRLGRSAFEE